MRLHRVATVAFAFCWIAGCGGGGKQQPTTAAGQPAAAADQIPKTAGPACAAVAEQLAIVLHADHAPDQRAAETKKTATTLQTQCESDKWTDEARNCFGSVQSQAELDGCTKLLTEPQRKAFTGSPGVAAAPKDSDGTMPAEAPTTKPHTRGAVKKDKTKKGDSDPDDGGE